jgi:hypothetical protein
MVEEQDDACLLEDIMEHLLGKVSSFIRAYFGSVAHPAWTPMLSVLSLGQLTARQPANSGKAHARPVGCHAGRI